MATDASPGAPRRTDIQPAHETLDRIATGTVTVVAGLALTWDAVRVSLGRRQSNPVRREGG